MTMTREVAWGEGLVVAGFRTPGGLKIAVERIRAVVGPFVGTRNTFAKLYNVTDPGELGDRDLFRAWLLLAALGQEPAGWGVDDSTVPPPYDAATLRASLSPNDEGPDSDESDPSLLPRLDSNQQPSGFTSTQVSDLWATPEWLEAV